MLRDLFFQIVNDTRARSRALAVLFLFWVCTLPGTIEAQVKPIRRVLILSEIGNSSPSVSLLEQQIRVVLEKSPFQIELYSEYLETTLFPDPEAQEEIRDWYIHKYRNRKPDLVIALGPSPLRFLVYSHKETFEDVPVVFGGLSGAYLEMLKLDSRFTGVWDRVEPAEILKIALRLRPGTKRVVVVGGTDAFDLEVEAWFHERLRSYESGLDFTYLTDLTMPKLLERLSRLPADTIVLLTHIGQDAAGTRFVGASQADPLVANAANVPVFGYSDVDLGHGEVGGFLESFALQGKLMGEMATKILEGERPADIPVVRGADVYMFDWRALKRWGMKEKNLPPGSIVLNRQPGFWELYKRYVIVALVLIFAQSAAIVGLLWQRERRRKAEAEFRKSEERFSKSFRRSPLAITIVTANDGRYMDVNETFERQTGWRRDEVIGLTPSEINLWLDPNQRSLFMKQLLAEGNVRDIEVRYRRKDGQIRTALGSAELIEVNGQQCALSVVADITERKVAEETLASLSGRLIEAQEAERTRIARELHDDINQRLAMVAVNLKTFKQDLPASEVNKNRYIEEACAQVSDLENDIQALSHRLHSSKLEYLGLEAAASGFCAEISQRQTIRIDFRCDGIPEDLSDEISLCLFRVLQEAVHNAVKYSGVREIEVSIAGRTNEIELMVHDSGAGFDPNRATNGNGLGLTSMKERLRLIHGQLSVDSKPQHGTTILARVPLDPEKNTAGAAA